MTRPRSAGHRMTGSVETPPDPSWTRLREVLKGRDDTLVGDMVVERVPGGQSNPTYFLTFANRSLVLRKQPGSTVDRTAHRLDREYRVMACLAGSEVPVPRVILYSEDASIVGTPFYLMERVAGRICRSNSIPEIPLDLRAEVFRSMAATLAALHRVDWRAIGLADFGRPADYCARQVARLGAQWESAPFRDNPDLDELLSRMRSSVPRQSSAALCHGDFRVGNLVLDEHEPKVVGVLDWELSTIGDPVADLAYACIAWRTASGEYGGLADLDLASLGIPSETQFIGWYRDAGGVVESPMPFHYAFVLFRLAVIFEGIALRARQGVAASTDAAQIGKLSRAFARRGLEQLARQ